MVSWLDSNHLHSSLYVLAGGDAPKDRFSKEKTERHSIPIYSNGVGDNALYGYTNLAKIEKRCITISARGTIGYPTLRTEPFYPIIRLICAIPKENITADFLYFVIETITFQVLTSGIPQLTVPMISKYKIPLPPLPVQEEIVRILDNFTKLTAELTVELTARKKQYEYYRDSLLTFGDEVPRVVLGEFATIVRGGSFQKKDFTETGVPCIHYGQIYTKYGLSATETIVFISQTVAKKSKFASKNDIVMAVTSENVEDVCKCLVWLGEEDAAISGHTAIIKHNQNSKFLAYYFHSAMFFRDKIKLAHGTKVIEVTPSKLADIKIPLPPLPEQQRIVDILDRFDTLCNDISSGLPAEIKARQQQYEYYRDKLLTFSKADAEV